MLTVKDRPIKATGSSGNQGHPGGLSVPSLVRVFEATLARVIEATLARAIKATAFVACQGAFRAAITHHPPAHAGPP